MMVNPDLRQYCHIFEEPKPCIIWKSHMNCWDISGKIYAVSHTDNEHQLRPVCNSLVTNIFLHASCSCPCTFSLREEWWCDIADIDLNLCAELCGLPEDELFLPCWAAILLQPTELNIFRMKNFRLLRNTAAAYKRALNCL